MKPEHKKYISENIGRKSLKEIASDLGLREGQLTKYVKKHHIGQKERVLPSPDYLGQFSTKFLIILLALFVMAVYANSIIGKFVWDDQTIVVRNEAIKNFKNIPFVFSHDFANMTKYNGGIYRPMQELSYMVDFFLYRMRPAGFHITNILLHIGCVLILFYVILSILGSKSVAFFSAMIFGIHPVNTEAVTYISGRSDPLSLFFLLASFVLYIKVDHLKRGYAKIMCAAASIVFFCCALLSREIAMVFPFILIGYEICGVDGKRYKNLYKVLFFVMIVAAFLALRSKIMPPLGSMTEEPTGNFGPALPLVAKIIVKYLYVIAFPVGLHMWNAEDIVKGVVEREFFLNISILTVLAIAAIMSVRRDRKSIFWLLWFIVFLLPHLNIAMLNAPFAEHWVYASSIGIYVIVVTLVFRAASKYNITRWTILLSLSLIIACLCFLTVLRNMDWKDEPSIYNNTLKYARYTKVLSNLGVYYDINGQYDKSLKVYQEAIAITPNVPLYHNNIAIIYGKMGNYELAVKHWKRSLELNPDQPEIKEMLVEYGQKG